MTCKIWTKRPTQKIDDSKQKSETDAQNTDFDFREYEISIKYINLDLNSEIVCQEISDQFEELNKVKSPVSYQRLRRIIDRSNIKFNIFEFEVACRGRKWTIRKNEKDFVDFYDHFSRWFLKHKRFTKEKEVL